MRKIFSVAVLASAVVFFSTNCALADELPKDISDEIEHDSTLQIEKLAETKTEKNSENKNIEVSNLTPPLMTTPVIEDPKTKEKKVQKPDKIDLKAIIFDADAKFNARAIEENREMTREEQFQYNLHNALHGEVQAVSLKGLMEDKMKIKFEEGPIESIAPWFDFNGNFSNVWKGDDYVNTLYGINFMDFGVNGKFRDGKTVFRVMVNYGRELEGNTYLQSFPADIYVTRQITKNNKVLVGYARGSIGVEGGESPFTIPFFARSQISRNYGNVRALGVKFMGDYPLFDYSASFNSSGRFFKDFFPGPEFIGWANFKPLGKTDGRWGKLTVGGGLNAGNAQSHYCVGGAYVNYDYKRLKATLEYAAADGSNGSTGFSANKSEGYYGTLAYRITPKLQALVRYDKFDPNKDKANDMRTEYTAGINYFIKGQALKLMLNYVYYTLENGTFGSKIMVGTQIIL